MLGSQLESRNVRGLAESPNKISQEQLRDMTSVLKDGETLSRGVGRGQIGWESRDHFHAVWRRIPTRQKKIEWDLWTNVRPRKNSPTMWIDYLSAIQPARLTIRRSPRKAMESRHLLPIPNHSWGWRVAASWRTPTLSSTASFHLLRKGSKWIVFKDFELCHNGNYFAYKGKIQKLP